MGARDHAGQDSQAPQPYLVLPSGQPRAQVSNSHWKIQRRMGVQSLVVHQFAVLREYNTPAEREDNGTMAL